MSETRIETRLLIGGLDQAASTGATYQRLNPATGDTASVAAAATLTDANAAVAAAQAAFPTWSATAPGERRRLLLKAADCLEARAPEFIAAGVAEAGGVPGWYGFNVMLAAGMLREAASMTTQIAGEVIPSDVPGLMAMGVRQACGVVLGIAPWNAPVILGMRAIATPLACGNTVVLKSSEICPALHRLIGKVFEDAGFPAGVVNVISNAPQDAASIVGHLIANPAVKRVNFTGSTKVGRIIAKQAAQYLKPVVLELGGKNPLLVLDDADLDEAVQAAAFGAFFNQGQICMSTDRIIVDSKVADQFVEKLKVKTASLRAGKPGQQGAVLGGMVDGAAASRVAAMIDDARAKGATLVCGSTETDGNVLQPAIIDYITSAMAVYQEESFGPIVAIIRVDGDEAALAEANAGEYGLSAAVFSRDISRALALARRIESGICHINSSTVADEAQMPFGGVKASGYGRFGGKAGVAEFTDLRWITIQSGHRHYPV
ncbi:aldehyde dehydrogenase [Undibacterium sp. RuTC16W]|uniref:aldehyde dehydrogenase n=1 Tax=Undibacterium sp. RuTC16W TaxID=3413048 RepID=UPI003BF3F574